jgi:hypothetical protein
MLKMMTVYIWVFSLSDVFVAEEIKYTQFICNNVKFTLLLAGC